MNSPTIQHCVFHDGGFVLHKITGNGYQGRFSAWFDRAGKLLDAEQIYTPMRTGGPIFAHRLTWIDAHGAIPADKVIDHTCRNRACVNPSHMRLVTIAENVLSGLGQSAINQLKSHCPNGHPYDIIKKNGNRACRTCQRDQQRNRYNLARAALARAKGEA